MALPLFGINCLIHTAFTNSIALQTCFCYSPRSVEPPRRCVHGVLQSVWSGCRRCIVLSEVRGSARRFAERGSHSARLRNPLLPEWKKTSPALLSYLVGWVTGLIFLLIDKRPFVKFHAAQSIAFNICIFPFWIALWIVELILAHIPLIGFLGLIMFPIFGLVVFGIWIFLMYQGVLA